MFVSIIVTYRHIVTDLVFFSYLTQQAGGELADFIIVLRNTDAIRTFSGKAHLSVGAGVGASACHVGRVAEADFRAGDGGYAACYTYSCSKGVFLINIPAAHDFGILFHMLSAFN